MPARWSPVPTPPATQLRAPTEGELATYKTGPNRFPNIGEFKVYNSIEGATETAYNCFAWSLGYQDRWIEGGSREQMRTLYAHYYYVACTTAEAEVDVYDIPDTPATITRQVREIKHRNGKVLRQATTEQCPNHMRIVLHAHRNDDPTNRLSSSKLAMGARVQHGRQALEDTRPCGARRPPIMYGTIYGHFKKHPDHPSLPGKTANKLPVKPPGPQDPCNAIKGSPDYPSGSNPAGNPHDSLRPPFPVVPHPPCNLRGAAGRKPGPANNGSATAANPAANPAAKPPAVPQSGNSATSSSSSRNSRQSSSSSSDQRPSSSSSSSRPSSSSSNKTYRKAPRMDPFAPVPPPSAAAVKSATDLYDKLKNTSPDLEAGFDTKYKAWKATWFSNNDSPNSDTRATGPKFDALVELGPKIIPFVVNKLTKGENFMAVVLYNQLETNICYKVDPKDILNYKVLQRHANLLVDFNRISEQLAASDIIEMGLQRNTDIRDALDRWAELREQRQNYSSSIHFCDGEGYWDLVDMGPSIIAQVMLEYYDDHHGWWHELLHELVHGRVSGAGVFFKDALFEEWKDWFEHKDHKDAPHGADKRAQREPAPNLN